MRIKLFLPLLFPIFFLTSCFNPVKNKILKEQIDFGNDTPTDMSLLWRIDSKNLKNPSYLFGTMHLIQEKYWFFPESLKQRIEKAEKLVLEINGIPNLQESLALITLEEGSFFDFFNEEQLDSVYTFLKEQLGLEKRLVDLSFSKMKPLAVIQMATVKQFGQDAKSYEVNMNNIAKENQIETIGLETAQEQMELFDNLSKSEQAEMVMQVIRTFDTYENELNDMQRLYKNQRIDSLYYMVKDEGKNLGPTEVQLLENRNKNWIPKIKKIIKKNNAFIAVGAAHLYGKEGVIELLKKENYTLTPIHL